ncbi:DUF3263 domain-containing protein [Corynebacterium uterequi]|uniref:Putative DUF3263 family protein n=1 Tax=Corynebacterium uterequi TaxID=1072256 RepID=A0A0G3HF25_9CORY|nr:putative DUF3263 family protein [Corynebacterium uterequi]
MPALSDVDARILEFEQRAPQAVGAKEEAIRAEFDMSPIRYYQHLNLLVDVPEVMARYPLLAARLRRRRDRRADERERARERK